MIEVMFMIERLNIVKIAIIPKLSYTRIQQAFIEIDKLILKFMGKCKGPRIVLTAFKNNKVEHYSVSNLTQKIQ